MHQPAFQGAPYTRISTFPKNPKVSDLKKEWCVYFHYLHQGTWHHIRRKGNVNRIKTFNEKTRELQALKKALKLAMDKGWNPVTKTFKEQASDPVPDTEMKICAALQFALDNADLSENTFKNYRNTLKKIKQAIAALSLDYLPMKDVRRVHIKTILEKACRMFDWTNKSYNKHLGYLQAIISNLFEWEVIEYNPAHRIKPKPVFEAKPMYVPYTAEEKKKIVETLFLNHYGYYVFFMTIYYTGMRPLEVMPIDLNLSQLFGF